MSFYIIIIIMSSLLSIVKVLLDLVDAEVFANHTEKVQHYILHGHLGDSADSLIAAVIESVNRVSNNSCICTVDCRTSY